MKKEMFFLILSGILYGTVISGGTLLSKLGLSSYEISFTNISVQCLIFFLIFIKQKQKIQKKDFMFLLIFGFVNAFAQITWTGAVSLGLPVAMATLLLYTQPFWTLILGFIIYKEKISRLKIISLLIIIFGIYLLVSPWNTKGIYNPIGLIFGILSGLLYSVYLIFSKETTQRKMHYSASIFGQDITTLLWLLLILPFYQFFVKDNNLSRLSPIVIGHNFLFAIIISMIIRIGPIFFLYQSIGKIPVSTVGIVLLIEPVVGSILAFFLFGQTLTLFTIVGGLLILLSNYLVIKNND